MAWSASRLRAILPDDAVIWPNILCCTNMDESSVKTREQFKILLLRAKEAGDRVPDRIAENHCYGVGCCVNINRWRRSR